MVKDIIDVVSSAYGVTRDEVLSSNRRKALCEVRYIVCCFYRDLGLSLHEIGRRLNRDHSTIVRSLKVYKDLYEYDKKFRIIADKFKDVDLCHVNSCIRYGEEIKVEDR